MRKGLRTLVALVGCAGIRPADYLSGLALGRQPTPLLLSMRPIQIAHLAPRSHGLPGGGDGLIVQVVSLALGAPLSERQTLEVGESPAALQTPQASLQVIASNRTGRNA
ncbi:MAG TPA: hypothetical protein VNZ23_07920 [Xanthobacteraceae bacterium]|nr:hypothetical protein [Xanthobacteraceae bacterium]